MQSKMALFFVTIRTNCLLPHLLRLHNLRQFVEGHRLLLLLAAKTEYKVRSVPQRGIAVGTVRVGYAPF
jgi:hypothetical protein